MYHGLKLVGVVLKSNVEKREWFPEFSQFSCLGRTKMKFTLKIINIFTQNIDGNLGISYNFLM